MSACPPYARCTMSAGTMLCVALAYACAGAPVTRTTDEPANTGNITATPVDPLTSPFVAALPVEDTTRTGIALRLLDPGGSSTPTEPAPTTTQSLPSERAQALLEQLAGPAPVPIQRTAFRFPSTSLPAPRPGTTTLLSFGGATMAAPATSSTAPLRIMHTSPRGSVATTSQISITFSQPMVELSSPPPAPAGVRITPEIRGAWRWLDPVTLVYEADGEFPAATRYTVSVPAGLRSAAGAALAQPLEWTFATPAPGVRDVLTMDAFDQGLPFIIIAFDQRIDPAAALPLLRLEVNGRDIPLRSATAAELAQPFMARIRTMPEGAVVVRPVGAIEVRGAEYFVTARMHVAPGLASLEGPLQSTQPAVHEFTMQRTFGVVEHGCGRVDVCIPGVPWTIRFTLPLRAAADTASWVRVEPALPGATIQVWNDHIVILGSPRPNTTYTVYLDSTISTYRNARLGMVTPLRFTIGAPAASLWFPGGTLAALTGDHRMLPLLVQGTDAVDVEVRAVSPADWPAYMTYLSARRHSPEAAFPLPGRVLFKRNVTVTSAAQGPGEARIDLGRALDESGHVIVVATAPHDSGGYAALTWVQKGNILLDVAEHGEALTVRATDAAGQPLRDVQLQLHATMIGNVGTARSR